MLFILTLPQPRTLQFFVGVLSLNLAGLVNASLTDDLELYYSYDNDTTAQGGIHDGSSNARNGSGVDKDLFGIDYGFSSDVPTEIGAGQSLDLSATTDFVISDTPGYLGVTGTTDRTIATWVKITDIAFATTLMEWGGIGDGERWGLRVNYSTQGPARTLRLEVNNGFIMTNGTMADGEWHHVAATLVDDGFADMTNVTLYIDGVEQGQSAFAQEPINTTAADNVTIGGSVVFPGDDRSMLGLLDDTAIWSRALSDQEIASLAAGAPIPEPSSVLAILMGGALAMRRQRAGIK